MEERPKIKLELTITDKLVEIIGWLTIIAIWGLTITSYAQLPGIIPTHYCVAGEVIIFGLIAFKTIQNANGQTEGLGIRFLPLTLGLTFIPLIYAKIKSFKAK